MVSFLRVRWLLLLIIFVGVILPRPVHGQFSGERSAIIYANTQGGLSIITIENGEFSTPRLLMPATNPASSEYRLVAAPSGGYIAVFRRYDVTADLSILTLPEGTSVFSQHLLPENFQLPASAEVGDTATELWHALGTMAWSPDSTRLAFVSGQAGDTADLRVVSVPAGEMQALEAEPGAAALPEWSPTGKWLVYSDLQTFGGEAGFLSQGIFALGMVAENSGQVIRLELPAAYPNDGIRVGWRDAETMLFAPRSFIAGARGLYSWHIPTNNVQSHLPETLEMSVPVYAPVGDIAAFIVRDLGANNPLAAGFYLSRLGIDAPIQIFEGEFFQVRLVNNAYFQLAGRNGELLLNAVSLEETVLPAGDIATYLSPDAVYVVAYFADVMRISQVAGTQSIDLPVREALIPDWLPGGGIFVTYGIDSSGAGLLAVNVVNGSVTLLDTEAAENGLRVIVGTASMP